MDTPDDAFLLDLRYSRSWTSVVIRPIANSKHPADGQSGLYATKKLEAGSFVLPYFGVVHSAADVDEKSDFDLRIDRDTDIACDAQYKGNEARFINDYRGIADGPNAEFCNCWYLLDNDVLEKGMGVFVLPSGKSGKRAAGIAKGEELLVSYGKGFWRNRKAIAQKWET